MKAAPLPTNERARLQSLREHELLDTMPEDVYNNITRIASEICETPIALITLVDKDRQWIKSRQGIDIDETEREYSFCAHAILNAEEVLIVPDARIDDRFHDNPLIIGEPNIVFYAGVPINDANGNGLGTLCVIDRRPRELSEQKLESLKALAKLVKAHFELRKTQMDLEKAQEDINTVQSLVDIIQVDIIDIIKNDPPADHLQQLTSALISSVDSIKNINSLTRGE